jgi:glycosyltransferase involved in cell wall biosynthesis
LEHLAARGVKFHVDLFGDEIDELVAPFPCSSHGILDAAGLAELYRNARIGICFSATNYSLVPQEMMACGLPVVEIDGESTRAVFPEGVVTLASPHPHAIADGIEALLRDPERRRRQAAAALEWVDQFDWEKSAKAIEHALLEKLAPAGAETPVALNGSRAKSVQRSGKASSVHISSIITLAKAPPKATVCIPTCDGGTLLTEVIKRVSSQRTPWPFEIIVIDSESTDGSIEQLITAMAKANGSVRPNGFRLERIRRAEFQHGRTRNQCASLARGEFVAFLTQDALPADEFWLYNLVMVLERAPGAAGAFGRHLPYPAASPFVKRDITGHFEGFLRHPLVLSRDTRFANMAPGTPAARKFLHFFSDNNACLRRSVWEAVPYPEINYGEDQVWADNIIQLGYEKIYAPAAVVYHSHSYTPTEIAERAAIEAFFFATQFGYELYDFKKTFPDQLASACNADIRWARGNGVSEEDLAQRLLENKAKLYGRAMGMERARDAVSISGQQWAGEPILQHVDRDRPPPGVAPGHMNGVSLADAR